MSAQPDDLSRDHKTPAAHSGGVTGQPVPADHSDLAAQGQFVRGEPSGRDHSTDDTHGRVVPASSPPAETKGCVDSSSQSSRLEDALLAIYADALDDLERVRIAMGNRVYALRENKGGNDTPEEARLVGLADALATLEHGVVLELKRALRSHRLGLWVKDTVGVGEKQGARLLAAIGDPYWHSLYDRPRRVSELWAFCGFHVVQSGDQIYTDAHDPCVPGLAPKRARGQKANWNGIARSRTRLIAESCIKQRHSPYRAVYDAGREKYADLPLTDLHKHNRALRLVAKAVLKDLWRESKRLHELA